MSKKGKPGFGRVGLAVLGCVTIIMIIAQIDKTPRASPPQPEHRFNIIFALGNTEKISATGLTWAECEKRKKELKQVAEGIGAYNEKLGRGSITCISERAYD